MAKSSISQRFHKKFLTSAFALSTGLLATFAANAANWSNTNLLYLEGSGYQLDGPDLSIFTFEHVSGWDYGSNFFFFDVKEPHKAVSNFYGEYSPTLSLSKMTGKDFSYGIIKDVSLAGTVEMGEVSSAKLFGLSVALDVPGVPVLTVTAYQRYSKSKFSSGTGTAPQVTVVWVKPFSIGSTNWTFEGYLDYAWEENEIGKAANLGTSPRLMLDLGEFLGTKPKTLYAGVEKAIWNNKYGIQGVDENVTNFTIKYTF